MLGEGFRMGNFKWGLRLSCYIFCLLYLGFHFVNCIEKLLLLSVSLSSFKTKFFLGKSFRTENFWFGISYLDSKCLKSWQEKGRRTQKKEAFNPQSMIKNTFSPKQIKNDATNLSPGTEFTRDPSFVSHVTSGTGLPWVTHVISAPVLLLKVTCDGGSWTNEGIWTPCRLWSLITIDAKHIW